MSLTVDLPGCGWTAGAGGFGRESLALSAGGGRRACVTAVCNRHEDLTSHSEIGRTSGPDQGTTPRRRGTPLVVLAPWTGGGGREIIRRGGRQDGAAARLGSAGGGRDGGLRHRPLRRGRG